MEYTNISGLKVKKSGEKKSGSGVRTVIVETLLAVPQGGAFSMIDLRKEVMRRFEGREITNPKQQSYVRINNTLHTSKKLTHITKCESNNGYTFLVNGDAEALLNSKELRLYDLNFVEGKPVFTKMGEEKKVVESDAENVIGQTNLESDPEQGSFLDEEKTEKKVMEDGVDIDGE